MGDGGGSVICASVVRSVAGTCVTGGTGADVVTGVGYDADVGGVGALVSSELCDKVLEPAVGVTRFSHS